MKNKYLFVLVMLLVLTAASIGLTGIYIRYGRGGGEADAFCVVTSFYPMYVAAENIIGNCEGIRLVNLSEPQTGCLHDYQLTTEDMRKLSTADAFIINGGGIENFLAETAERYPDLAVINASEQVGLLKDNAHAWMSIPDHMTQVRTITDRLAALDGRHRAQYEANCSRYLAQLEKLRLQQDAIKQAASPRVLIFHEAFAYLAKDCGFTVAGSMDLDEERQVSAGEVAGIIQTIRTQGAALILAEETYGKQICETIQEEVDVQVVYLDTCVRGSGDADSYLRAMLKNMHLIGEALQKNTFYCPSV